MTVTSSTPVITPDELGTWAVAKALVDQGPLMLMRDMPRYSLLSGAAIAPVEALGLDPTTSYRLALAWLSTCTVAAAFLVRRTVEQLRPGQPLLGAACFALTLLFPPTLVTSTFTWAEPVVLLWWALLFWGVVSSLQFASRRATMVTSVVAGLAPFVHGRFVAVPVIWAVALVSIALVRSRRSEGVLAIAITGCVALLAWRIDHSITARIWEEPFSDPTASGAIGGPGWWLGALTSLAGRTWYVMVTSLGLALFGALALLSGAVGRQGRAPRRAATVLGAMLAANLAIAVVFGATGLGDLTAVGELGGRRWDHLVYGRYIDVPVLLLSVLGLMATLDTARTRGATRIHAAACVLVVASSAVLGARIVGLELAPTIDVMITGVAWLTPRTETLPLVWWTVVGLVAMAVAMRALRAGWQPFVVVMATWFALGGLVSAATTIERHRVVNHPDLAQFVGGTEQGPDRMVVPADAEQLPAWRLGVFAQQRDLTHRGWNFEFTAEDSREVASAAEDDDRIGALILLEGVRPPAAGWQAAAEWAGATIWVRSARPG